MCKEWSLQVFHLIYISLKAEMLWSERDSCSKFFQVMQLAGNQETAPFLAAVSAGPCGFTSLSIVSPSVK